MFDIPGAYRWTTRGNCSPDLEVTMNHVGGAAHAGAGGNDSLGARFPALNAEALGFVPRDKAENTARQWLSGVPRIVHDGDWAIARSLALELALMTPSVTGSTAFDRLARGMKERPEDDRAAVGLLCRNRPRLARLSGNRFEDLATGERRTLLPSPAASSAGDGVVFGRFATTADGCAIATGMLLRLDPEALVIARAYVRRDGRGLANPVHCAEAVFRHMVRRGSAAASWRDPKPELPFDPDHDPLDALAAAWASLDGEPGAEEIERAKQFIGIHPLLNALISAGIARDSGAKRLADAYRRIAASVVEFMAAREAYGSSQFSLDRAAAEVDAAITRGRCGFATKALFNELRERARLANGKARGGGASGDLDKLMLRIRALREKTVEQGCTEQEAMAAAEKVAELLDRYGLSLSELDLRKQSCEGIGVATGRRRRGPIDDCVGTIAVFFDCRVWAETAEDGTLSYIFFGLPGDVQASVYLHDLIGLAFAAETATFQRGDLYAPLDSGQRRSATNSFQVGLAHGIIEKLNALRRARDAASGGSNGRALVPVKQSIIEQEMERLGLTLRRLNATRRTVIPDAFSAGKEAGKKFEYRRGIAAGS